MKRLKIVSTFSVLNRVLEPTVLMEMSLSNGSIHTFEVRCVFYTLYNAK